MSTTRMLPFCPVEMDETQYASWNVANKQQWLGPYSTNTLFHLWWNTKNLVWSINGTGTSRYAVPNNARWVSPPGRWENEVPPTTTTFFWPSDTRAVSALNPARNNAEFATSPMDFICGGVRNFGHLDKPVASDSRMYFETQLFEMFSSFIPVGTGLTTSTRAIRRSATDEWWIGYRTTVRLWIAEPNANLVLVSLFATTPAGPLAEPVYFIPTVGFQDPRWFQNTDHSGGTANRPLLTLNVAGSSHTISGTGGDTTLDVMSHTILIDLSDPTQFF